MVRFKNIIRSGFFLQERVCRFFGFALQKGVQVAGDQVDFDVDGGAFGERFQVGRRERFRDERDLKSVFIEQADGQADAVDGDAPLKARYLAKRRGNSIANIVELPSFFYIFYRAHEIHVPLDHVSVQFVAQFHRGFEVYCLVCLVRGDDCVRERFRDGLDGEGGGLLDALAGLVGVGPSATTVRHAPSTEIESPCFLVTRWPGIRSSSSVSPSFCSIFEILPVCRIIPVNMGCRVMRKYGLLMAC